MEIEERRIADRVGPQQGVRDARGGVTTPEDPSGGRRTIRLRLLRAVFSREVLREDAPAYLSARRFSSPGQVYELFRDLYLESKENFVCLHLDAKHGLLCFDRVGVGTLESSPVHHRE